VPPADEAGGIVTRRRCRDRHGHHQPISNHLGALLRSVVLADAAMAEAWNKYPALCPQPQDLSNGLEGRVAALTEAVAKAKAVVEQRRQVIEAARKQIYGVAVEIVVLSEQLAEEWTASDKLLQQAEEALEDAKFNACWQRESIIRWTRRT
jgi:hypothetical protein